MSMMALWVASVALLILALVLGAAWIFYVIVVGGTCGESGESTPCWGAPYYVLPVLALGSLVTGVVLAWRAGRQR
jgi:hypothetical protein